MAGGYTYCDHEEVDTRLLIHLQDALQNGCTNCLVHTVDTDVVVILIGKFHHLITLCQVARILVAFGTGKNFTYHHINDICKDLGRENPWSSLSFTVSRDAILHLHSLEEAGRQHGRLGTAIKM